MVELQAEHQHDVVVNVLREIEEERHGQIVVVGEEPIATATAATVWEALADCSRQLQAKGDAEVAQGGTIEEPSGRPPGQ